METLLAHGADTEARSYAKLCMVLSHPVPKVATPLIIAARGGDSRAVQLLLRQARMLRRRMSLTLRTALYQAQLTKNVECAKVLEKMEVDSHKSRVNGKKT